MMTVTGLPPDLYLADVRHNYARRASRRLQAVRGERVRPFSYQNAVFIGKDENRVRLIHVGEGNTVNAESTIIP
jgi:hypothetical protein